MTLIKPCEKRRRLNCWENFTYKITYREDYLSKNNTPVTFHNSWLHKIRDKMHMRAGHTDGYIYSINITEPVGRYFL